MVPGARDLAGTWRGTALSAPAIPTQAPLARSAAAGRRPLQVLQAPSLIAVGGTDGQQPPWVHEPSCFPAQVAPGAVGPPAPAAQRCPLRPHRQASALSLSAVASSGLWLISKESGAEGLASSLPRGREPQEARGRPAPKGGQAFSWGPSTLTFFPEKGTFWGQIPCLPGGLTGGWARAREGVSVGRRPCRELRAWILGDSPLWASNSSAVGGAVLHPPQYF